MRDPFSQRFLLPSSQDSLLRRIRDNFSQLIASTQAFPSSANGAPIHLLKQDRSSLTSGPRIISFVTHSVLLAGVLFLHLQHPGQKTPTIGPDVQSQGPFRLFRMPDITRSGQPSLGIKSGGGEEESSPPRHGLLAPGSSMPILPPRRTVEPDPILPVPAAVFDPNSPQFPASVTNLGLPWVHNDSDSAGPGKKHGFGTGDGGGMGDDEGPGAGQGDRYGGPYANAVTRPACAYCPDPQYTDEAREAKLQGTVAVEVLISPDGRAARMRLVRGIGMGLDERALETIRTWKFIPARDAARRPIPTWITVEVLFRLI
jgi:TonB family protein